MISSGPSSFGPSCVHGLYRLGPLGRPKIEPILSQIFDSHQRTWMEVPVVHGALQVHVGDQLEVLSNGRYKSALHRVVLSTHKPRISVASLHAMGMVDEEHPSGYRESSFSDFLDFISKNDLGQGRGFLDTLKIIQK